MDAPGQAKTASPLAQLAAIPVKHMLLFAFGVAALFVILASSLMFSRDAEFRPLFTSLGDKDGGTVIATLSQMSVPYRIAAGGEAILVPAERVHELRMKLASQGLPRGGSVGFELMDGQKFGLTQFQERLNFQRALEGELTRSIQSIGAVQAARVHLALPAGSSFVRDARKASASVLLTLHAGRNLDRAQVAGIVHLVAASVPDLSAKNVSVVDQDGILHSDDASVSGGLDAAQLSYTRRIESTLNQRILDILEPIIGKGSVRSQVTAEIDFTRSEATAETYRPNQGNEPPAIRSQQTVQAPTDGAAADAQGIPGALSNQPAPPTGAPVNGAAQQVQGAGRGAVAGAAGVRRESLVNYEVDKTIRVTRNQTGAIKRLTAAVVLDHRQVAGQDGKTSATPLTAAELESINALVREAIGFSKERGDSINVVNTPFTREALPVVVEPPMWKDPQVIEMAKTAGKHVGLVLLGLLTILMVIRPSLKSLRESAAQATQARVSQVVGGDVALPAPAAGGATSGATATAPGSLAAPHGEDESERILRLARENPATVANVVRGWVGADA